MKFKYPLATSSWDKKEVKAMQKVIDSAFFTMGERVKSCETDFSNYIGSKFCVMVNSGSSAILLMIAALFYTKNPRLKLNRGDEIIVPAVSWGTTYFPLYQFGLKLKFVDINLETLNYDLDQLEKAVSKKTRAIMVVNLLGNPNDFDRINQIIDGRKILLLEDNCESMGAKYNKKFAGTYGIMGGFSSFFSHHISTMEGGFIVTDDEELYQILTSLRAHGWTRNLPKINLVCGEKSEDLFEESYRFILPGYNLRPLELSGALGVEQIKKLPSIIKQRRKNGLFFQKQLRNNENFIIQTEIGESSWFGFSLIIKKNSKLQRKDLIDCLTKAGFECRPIVAGNFTKNPVMKYFYYEIHGDLHNADYVDKKGLFIGNHHYCIKDAITSLSALKIS